MNKRLAVLRMYGITAANCVFITNWWELIEKFHHAWAEFAISIPAQLVVFLSKALQDFPSLSSDFRLYVNEKHKHALEVILIQKPTGVPFYISNEQCNY